ncbi:hypothetical protein LTR17_024059 [Elasticomyces elasticus]|nr:hypothetical protein LTR17_024059 [Elasticomyces elasticus]
MRWRKVTALFCALEVTTAHLITSPATLPRVTPTAYPGIGVGQDDLFGRLPGHQLFKRASIPCDGNSFWCPTGTCFKDEIAPNSGLIGCCSIASCIPRTQCIPYTSGVTSPCDVNTGGCMYCSDSKKPACLTMSNEVGGAWIQYCAEYASTQTVSYTVTGSYPGSQLYGESSVATSTRGQASFSAVPGMQVRPSPASSSPTSSAEDGTTESFTTTETASSTTSNSEPSVSCSPSGCIVTSTSLISLLPAASNDATLNIEAQNSSSNTTSPGLIAGVAVGAAAVCALIAAALWFTRRRWLPCCGGARHNKSSNPGSGSEKLSSLNSTPPSTGQTEAEKNTSTFLSPDHISQPVELEGRSGSVSAPWPVDTITVRGLGIAGVNQKRYAPTNPDPTSATDAEEHSPVETSPPVALLSEATNDRPLPASPAISGPASPPTSPVNTPEESGAVSPLTPAYKHTSTAPYTPSAYAYEPPSSVPRTVVAAPPSLQQEYSLVSLGSSSNIYRGLSQRGGAPWAYLSPEDAVRGGWRNGEDA